MAKLQIKEVSGTRYKANVQTTPEEVSQCETRALASVRSKVKIDGFRKGKVPEHVIKTRFGGDIAEKTLQNLLEMSADQIAKESEHGVYQVTSVENVKPDPAGYSLDILFDTHPIITLGKLKGLTIKEDTPVISDDDLNKELKEALKSFVETEPKGDDAVAEKGDTVELKYEQWIDGAPAGPPNEGVSVWLGENRFDEEIEKKIVAAKIKVGGEVRVEKEFDAPVTDEEGKQTGTEKKKVDIVVHITKIMKTVFPELTDELAAKYDPSLTSAEELKNETRKNMETRFHSKNMNEQIAQVMEKLNETSQVDFPENFISDKMDEYVRSQGQSLANIPEKELAEFKTVFENEQKKRTVNEELMRRAMKAHSGENYKEGFINFLKESHNEKTAETIGNIYTKVVEGKEKNDYMVKVLNNFLDGYHMHLLELYFKEQGLVKKNKKIAYSEYMK